MNNRTNNRFGQQGGNVMTHPHITAAKITAIATLLATFLTFFLPKLYQYFTTEVTVEYFIVANSTSLLEEAKVICDKYHAKGFEDAAVYTSSNGYFAVTLGKYEEVRAKSIKQEAISNGVIKDDAYLVSQGLNFKKYPLIETLRAGTSGVQHTPREQVCIVIRSTPNKSEAIRVAKQHGNSSIPLEVRISDNDLYAVTTCFMDYDDALKMLDENKHKGYFRTDSYLASNGFVRTIYNAHFESNGEEKYQIFAYSTTLKSDANRYLRILKRKLNGKYNAHIIYSTSSNYAVVFGAFSLDEAREKKKQLIRRGKINPDAFVARLVD